MYGRKEAIQHFDPDLAEGVLLFGEPDIDLKQLPDMFDVETTTTAGYVRNTYIVADTRSSQIVHIYVTTKFPYDD